MCSWRGLNWSNVTLTNQIESVLVCRMGPPTPFFRMYLCWYSSFFFFGPCFLFIIIGTVTVAANEWERQFFINWVFRAVSVGSWLFVVVMMFQWLGLKLRQTRHLWINKIWSKFFCQLTTSNKNKIVQWNKKTHVFRSFIQDSVRFGCPRLWGWANVGWCRLKKSLILSFFSKNLRTKSGKLPSTSIDIADWFSMVSSTGTEACFWSLPLFWYND